MYQSVLNIYILSENQLALVMVCDDQLEVGKSIELAGIFGGLLLFSSMCGLTYRLGYILVLTSTGYLGSIRLVRLLKHCCQLCVAATPRLSSDSVSVV